MKYLLSIFACLMVAVSAATAQQEPPKPTPSIQPTAEALMKAQANTDKAMAKHDEASVEELKKFVEREIAKSAALPVTITVQEPLKPEIPKTSITFSTGMVVIDGAVYIHIGNVIVPMAGGGASGCFSLPEENAARIQRAQAKFAEINKTQK
ncbi:MAG: hypothetical protein ACKVZH_01095 [Blastocatellia bacterium]